MSRINNAYSFIEKKRRESNKFLFIFFFNLHILFRSCTPQTNRRHNITRYLVKMFEYFRFFFFFLLSVFLLYSLFTTNNVYLLVSFYNIDIKQLWYFAVVLTTISSTSLKVKRQVKVVERGIRGCSVKLRLILLIKALAQFLFFSSSVFVRIVFVQPVTKY